MPDHDALDERLRAVERALTDDEYDHDLADLGDAAELAREVDSLSARLDDAEDRLDRLDAATQALRGYVGNVRAVNDAVERRADAALAKVEALEADRESPEDGSSELANSDAGTSPHDRSPSEPRATSRGQSTSRGQTTSSARRTSRESTPNWGTTGRERDCACECASGAPGRAAVDSGPTPVDSGRAAVGSTDGAKSSESGRASPAADDGASGLLARLVAALAGAKP